MTSRVQASERSLFDRLDEIRNALGAVYREVDEQIAGAGPVCQLSGRCCRFQEYGHTLFLSAAEAALLVADAPRPVRELDQGSTCPWQDRNGRCTARDARPLGCRVYFCDPSFESRMPVVTELAIARLKRLAAKLDWPWNYAPLHEHLRRAEADGRLAARFLCSKASLEPAPEGLESSIARSE
jgi:Fe-S-cluster containining protein